MTGLTLILRLSLKTALSCVPFRELAEKLGVLDGANDNNNNNNGVLALALSKANEFFHDFRHVPFHMLSEGPVIWCIISCSLET